MRNLILFICLIFSLNNLLHSQDLSSKILMSIDEDKITVKEFLRVYNKNLDLVKDQNQKEVDYYLNLYSNYRLKLKEARALKYDQKQDYIKEFDSYKKQLSKAYLTDKEVTDNLVEEAYYRTANEVKVQHILVKLNPGQDTLDAYKKINLLKKRFNDETFLNLKSSVHDGKDIFVEDLGYFSAFKMVYDFENIAFNTPINEISNPFKTQFGYHVLKVLDKRPSKGSVQVSHIMISNSNSTKISPEDRINQIYNSISNGASFEDLAKQFSDDKSSASRGGLMNPFSSGDINSEIFVNTAFNLNSIGDISKPIKTQFGWHIIKLISKNSIKTFDEIKLDLGQKIKRDSRSRIIRKKMIDKLKHTYNVLEPGLAYINNGISINQDKFILLNESLTNSSIFIKIENKSYSVKDFLVFLNSNFRSYDKSKNIEDFLNKQYSVFLDQSLFNYKKDNLINENQDYANVLKEYEEGLLLFDIMEEKIWNGAKNDTIGLKKYYNSNLDSYKSKFNILATIINSPSKKLLKEVLGELDNGISSDSIIKKFSNKNLIINSGKFNLDDPLLPQVPQFRKNINKHKIYKLQTGYVVVNIDEVVPSKILSFDEVKGSVIADFQTLLESKWIDKLRSKYNLIVYNDVLDELKRFLN